MSVIKTYWKAIFERLLLEHPEKKPPTTWTRTETQPFLEKLQNKVGKTISYTTFLRIFREGDLGKAETRDIFAKYYNYDSHGDYIKREINQNKKRKYWFIGLSIAAIAISGMLYFFWPIREEEINNLPDENDKNIIYCAKKL